MKKIYELTILYSPELAEQQLNVVQDSLISLVKKHKGAVVASEVWGRRPLAYDINRFSEANYLYFDLEFDTQKVGEFERDIRLLPEPLRHLLVIKEAVRSKSVVSAAEPERSGE